MTEGGGVHAVEGAPAVEHDVAGSGLARVKVQLRVEWTGVDDLPIVTANNFLAQVDQAGDIPDLAFLTIGQAVPPVAIGTPEEQAKTLTGMGAVHVKGLARYAVSPARLRELIELLQRVEKVFDPSLRAGNPE